MCVWWLGLVSDNWHSTHATLAVHCQQRSYRTWFNPSVDEEEGLLNWFILDDYRLFLLQVILINVKLGWYWWLILHMTWKVFVAWVSSYNSYHVNIKCNYVASTELIICSFWWSNLKMTLTIRTCFPYHVNINLFVIWSISDNWHLIITMYS